MRSEFIGNPASTSQPDFSQLSVSYSTFRSACLSNLGECFSVSFVLTSGVCLKRTGRESWGTRVEIAGSVDEVEGTCPVLIGYHIHLLEREFLLN